MIKYGVSPIAWTNDDLPSLGGDTPLETCLAEIREVGFDGVELGGKFPRRADALAPLLKQYNLELVGGWYSSNLLKRSAQEEIAALQDHLALLKAMNCGVFIIAETSNAIHGDQTKPLRDQPTISDADWRIFCERMSAVGDYMESEGLRLAYHHHLGTVVEKRPDIERFLELTNKTVGLTLDVGHAAAGGVDAAQILHAYPSRIAHVHCKDIRSDVFNRILNSGESFLDGVIEGMFTVPGDGDVDFAPAFEALQEIDYSGWIIVEAEQDPARAPPKEYALMGLETLKGLAAGAGLGA